MPRSTRSPTRANRSLAPSRRGTTTTTTASTNTTNTTNTTNATTTTTTRTRQRMARQLGFETSAGLARWEDGIVNDHFANFVCDYLAHGYTVEPDRAALVGYVDLERAVGERIRMLERRRFEMMGDLDKGEWTARDHYKEFVVGVVADDRWLAKFGLEHVELCKRGWTARETTEKMIKFLDFLIKEWGEGAGDSSHREKTGQVQVLRG